MTHFTITPFQRRYRQAVSDLLFRSYRVHTHLDWHEPEDWLEISGIITRLAWQGVELAGILAASEVMGGTSWLRIAALRDQPAPQPILNALWSAVKTELLAHGAHTVSLLIIRDWITRYAVPLGFQFAEQIVTLQRQVKDLPLLNSTGVVLRPAVYDDLSMITAVDNAAFAAPWQLNALEMRQAMRISAYSTIALLDTRIVGYQITTTYRDTAHLARLAVAPDAQGRKVGAVLLDDMLRTFLRRNILTVTVNTQATNEHSQRLYQQYDFFRNGYDLPIWQVHL